MDDKEMIHPLASVNSWTGALRLTDATTLYQENEPIAKQLQETNALLERVATALEYIAKKK